MAVSMIGPKFYAWDNDGKPLAYGKLYTYQAGGTDINKPTYQSEGGTTENSNPVILNGEGYADVYLSGSYSMVLKDANDNDIWSEDPVTSQQANEWNNCLDATYISPTSLKVSGNQTDVYTKKRGVRIDNGTGVYAYSNVESVSYSSLETTLTFAFAVVGVAVESICSSIIGENSTPSGLAAEVDTISNLSGKTGRYNGQSIYLSSEDRSGWFNWDSSNLEYEVSSDTLNGIYVAPSSDDTGSSGAWVRVVPVSGVTLGMFGADTSGGADSTDEKVAAYKMAAIYGCNVIWGNKGDSFLIGVPSNLDAAKVSPSVDTDFNGVSIIANNCTSADNLGAAILHYNGEVSSNYNLSAITEGDGLVTFSTASDSDDWGNGDWGLIVDSISLPSWKGTAGASTGRRQIVQVSSVSAGVLNLTHPAEWDMSTSTTIRKLTDYDKTPIVKGNPIVTQIDPLAASVFPSGAGVLSSSAPHIVRFENCREPKVIGGITMASGWQVHVVNFNYCWKPYVEFVTGENPFRPENPSHGYCVQFAGCSHGLAFAIQGTRTRHVVDFSYSYDSGSKNCVALSGYNTDYYCHGLSSKRCWSESDTAYNTDEAGTAFGGWGCGNHAFAADYDYEVRNPKFEMVSPPFVQQATSENMKIINPNGKVSGAWVISHSTGSKNIQVIGGKIELYATATSHALVYGRDKQDSDLLVPEDAIIDGTEVVQTGTSGRILSGSVSGDISIDAKSSGGGDVAILGSALNSDGGAVAHGTVILKGRYDAVTSAVSWASTPTELLHIEVQSLGFTGKLITDAPISANGDLVITRCNTFGDDTDFFPSGDEYGKAWRAISAGAIIRDNKPDSYDQTRAQVVSISDLEDISHYINTGIKYRGLEKFISDTQKPVWARTLGAGATWISSDDTIYTPV